MIDSKTKLTVLHDDNGTFVDHTDAAADYLRDNFDVDLFASEDYLYIGFEKPVSTVYVEIPVPNENDNVFTLEYHDGTAWTTAQLDDGTKGFTRSGYMEWAKASLNAVEVDGITKYFVRLRPNVDHTVTTIRGINLVFSCDSALKSEFFEVDNAGLLPAGETSHIVHHVAARNAIVQRLRNLGYLKTDSGGVRSIVDQWDLHNIQEIRQAATMLALAKIFFNLSDSPDDNWFLKYREYQDKYEESFRLSRLSMDENDDGVEDSSESQKQIKHFRFQR